MAEKDGRYWIEDVVRAQVSTWEREELIRQTAAMDAADESIGHVAIWIEQEPGSGGKDSALMTIRNLAGYNVRADRPTTNKDARLEPFIAQLEAGNVYIVAGPWNTEYLDELTAIPHGHYRDQADATAGAFMKLAKAQPARKRPNPFF